ncbi:hypothetical protein ACFOY2_05230 [Nonomuraea purpurea]|uniref:Uncharacterized protein n=1 Tax=Nonomuraea purpurea TaxID=1849276 RepID=A0ABV8FYS6_9ACTN
MRIQILPLPSVMVGDDMEEPFAIVVDQCPKGIVSEWFAGQLTDFAKDCGGKAALVTPETVEIVDRYADADATDSVRLAAYLNQHFGDEVQGPAPADDAILLLGELLLRRDAGKMRKTINDVLPAIRQERVIAGWPKLQRDRSEGDE